MGHANLPTEKKVQEKRQKIAELEKKLKESAKAESDNGSQRKTGPRDASPSKSAGKLSVSFSAPKTFLTPSSARKQKHGNVFSGNGSEPDDFWSDSDSSSSNGLQSTQPHDRKRARRSDNDKENRPPFGKNASVSSRLTAAEAASRNAALRKAAHFVSKSNSNISRERHFSFLFVRNLRMERGEGMPVDHPAVVRGNSYNRNDEVFLNEVEKAEVPPVEDERRLAEELLRRSSGVHLRGGCSEDVEDDESYDADLERVIYEEYGARPLRLRGGFNTDDENDNVSDIAEATRYVGSD